MKKLIAFMLSLLMAFSLFGCKQQESANPTQPQVTQPEAVQPEVTQPQDEAKTGTANPLLYRVSDENGNVIWLFGSVHVGKEEYYPLPDYVMDAYNGSDALALEIDILAFQSDLAAQTEAAQLMVYTDGTDISDHIPEELYDQAVTCMENCGIYYSAMDYCIPVMWFSLLQQTMIEQVELHAELGLDQYFAGLAAEDGKETLELESAKFQYEMLSGFSDELQVVLLESAVQICQLPEVYKASLNMLMNYWASGDEEGFAAYLLLEDEAMKQTYPELYEEYYGAMIGTRNENMTQWAQEALASGKEVFIVVGAAHVVGDGAMAENLREIGYTVELVTP